MIYETIPHKYLFYSPAMVKAEFEKIVNSNKYRPEAHFVECMAMMTAWLEGSTTAVMEASTSEKARQLGEAMKNIDYVCNHINFALFDYFDGDAEKYVRWDTRYEDKKLRRELTNIFSTASGVKYNISIIHLYLSSYNMTECLKLFNVKITDEED